MEMLKGYFEILPCIVYIVDMETYKIVFMNKAAREAFQVGEEYQGQLCYHLLQGFQSPCLFCTNSLLHTSSYCEWEHHNPLLDRRYYILDTILKEDGKNYKIEMALDFEKFGDEEEKEEFENSIYRHEIFINQCLLQMYRNTNPMDEIKAFLEYIGEPSESSHIRIYEWKEDQIFISYSWPEQQQKLVQSSFDIKIAGDVKNRYESIGYNEPMYIRSTDSASQLGQDAIDYIRSEKIQSVLITPVFWNEKVIAFIRFDNIGEKKVCHVKEIMKILSYFLALMLIRRDTIDVLTELSYHDQLTGAFNRHAINEYKKNLSIQSGIGVVYCDAVGLKNINDTQGHTKGDQIIVKISDILTEAFQKESVYRVGGDEFVCIVDFLEESEFEERVQRLRKSFQKAGLIISIGSAFREGIIDEKEFEKIAKQADLKMYEDKRAYYLKAISPKSDTGHMGENPYGRNISASVTPLQYFVKNYYFNTEVFIRSIASPNTSLYLFCGDLQKNVFYISDNLKQDFDFPSNIVFDFPKELEARMHEKDRKLQEEKQESIFKKDDCYFQGRFRMYNKNKELVWVGCRGEIQWEDGQPLFFAGRMKAIKEDTELDAITGLLNVSAAMEELRYLSRDQEFTLFGFSIRNFENINQIVGFQEGDLILREISEKVVQALGNEFQVFRLDGLHFLAMTCENQDIELVVDQIKTIVEGAMNRHNVYTMKPCAIAVLEYGKTRATPQELIDNILMATKIVKGMQGIDFLQFSDELSGQNNINVRMSMDLNACITKDFEGFRVVMQPQVSASTGEIIGGEVLLRWTYKGENISPAKFIPILESSGIIVPIGKWIILQTIKTAVEVLKIKPDFKISFNLSYIQVMDETLFGYLHDTIRKYQIPGENIVIELTETYFDEMPSFFKRFVEQCMELGITFALDDFGNGYSSLNLLLKYPISIVKLDRSLLKELTTSEKKKKFIQSIIYACHSFEEKVCFEGVETKEELDIIRNTMCDYIQGFYFYKPLELEDFYEILRQKGGGELLPYKE